MSLPRKEKKGQLQRQVKNYSEHCCVPLCTASAKCNGVLSFHGFPTDLELQRQWLVNILRDNFTISSHSKVCSRHFATDQLIERKTLDGRRRLVKGAVPTLFEWNHFTAQTPRASVWEKGVSGAAGTCYSSNMATRWGICSTGRFSHDFTVALKTLPHEDHQVVAVAARELEDAQQFATKHSISRVYGSYEELARDPDIDVVYIGVYHPYRLMLFTNAKKNVLCEKPLAMNTKEILSSAKRNDIFLMEMYCPFCGSSVTAPHGVCGVCGRDITFLKDVANKVPEEMPTTSAHLSAQPSTSAAGSSAVVSLSSEKKQKIVKISVGVMRMMDGCLRPVRGRLLPLDVEPQWSCQELLAAAIKNQKAFKQVVEDGAHVLLYPDAREITNIPGTDIPFTVEMYKKTSGKPYQRIALYICTVEDFENSCYTGTTSSEEDGVVRVNLPLQ
ncbi:uncharacterized protein LOC117549146 isoform X1 [Gymnodraco acuticeps]|uniref:Trans-1,2-dihydrobenzene-1,2-diol dehydrogenase n=1 Tax=Gymnodraco acuticeps TaxID=8218 RepID=A0A6P8UK54_GYMAC|nr:uncharacterized protein LOC117549146 isoform X1 [Gymnodraco acuticeps]